MNKTITQCRACGSSELIPVVDFGLQPLANDFRKPGEQIAESVPLKVMYCNQCSLGQLSVVVDPHVLYDHYSYVTSTSKMMLYHFERLLADLKVERNGVIGKVLEIGSNDGTLLSFLRPYADTVCGVDPARNLAEIAQAHFVPTFCKLWNSETAAHLGTFDTIIARHVFCHCDDWNDFINALVAVSHDNTVIAIEVPYAGDLIKNNEFDTIYHEHLSYMSIKAINALLKNTPLYLSKIIRYPIHGGTTLLIIRKRKGNYSVVEDDNITAAEWKQVEVNAYLNVNTLKNMIKVLSGSKANRVFGYGASAKSTLWVSLCKFDKSDMEFIHDVTPQKQGCLSPGTNIPIFDAQSRIDDEMTHGVLFAWNYKNEIIGKEEKFASRSGHFIIPVPTIQYI